MLNREFHNRRAVKYPGEMLRRRPISCEGNAPGLSLSSKWASEADWICREFFERALGITRGVGVRRDRRLPGR